VAHSRLVHRAERLGERRDLQPRPFTLQHIGEGERDGFLLLLLSGDRRWRDKGDARGLEIPLAQRDHLFVQRRIVNRRGRAAGEQDEEYEKSFHPFSERLSTASAASRVTSDIDG